MKKQETNATLVETAVSGLRQSKTIRAAIKELGEQSHLISLPPQSQLRQTVPWQILIFKNSKYLYEPIRLVKQ